MASHVAVPKHAVEVMEIDQPSKMTLSVRASKHSRDLLHKLNSMRLAELHLTIEELHCDDPRELAQLHELSKHCRLDLHDLQALSVTYKAPNPDATHNPVRMMTLVNILNLLNWATCSKVDVSLQVNHLDGDSRLDLFSELPVNLSVSGETGAELSDDSQLDLLEQSYPYLTGCL